jgi:hypothetical protein
VADDHRPVKGWVHLVVLNACVAMALGCANGPVRSMGRDLGVKGTPVCDLLAIPDDQLLMVIMPAGLSAAGGPFHGALCPSSRLASLRSREVARRQMELAPGK